MDTKWFKQQQKKAGVTAEDIAKRMGKSRTNVSHIYSGNQRMSIEWAKAFAHVLAVPIDEVLERSGALEPKEASSVPSGMAEGDATPWQGNKDTDKNVSPALSLFGGDRAGVDVWKVQSKSIQLLGFMPDDFILIDTHAAESCEYGDIVVAQIYDWKAGSARTVLRRYEPPLIIPATTDTDAMSTHIVDGHNVVIKGKIIASWRVS